MARRRELRPYSTRTASRIHRAEACGAVSVKSSCVSGAPPPFAAGRRRLDTTCPCRSPSPSLHWTSLCAAHAPRLAPRGTRVFECVTLATRQPIPIIPFVHRGQGSQRAKRYGSAGEPFNSRAHAPPCVPNGLIHLVDACVHARARAGMSRQTSAELLSTCALDQTPAASVCGVRGLQGQVPTVLRYRECAMAGWRA